MKQFSLGNAWSNGVASVSRDAMNHAIILIGIGIVLPMVIQFALLGSTMQTLNPAAFAQGAMTGAGLAAFAGTILVASLVSYILQIGSYFGSWRLGFGAGETLGGAIVYGLVTALVIIVGFALFGVLIVLLAQLGAVGAILIFVAMLPLLAVMAALYTAIIAAVGVGMLFFLLLALAFGSAFGAMDPAFAMGGSAIGVLIVMALVALWFWTAVRFSCTGPIMADRKTFNLLQAMGESWRLTAGNQGRIASYLALVGLVLCVLFVIMAAVAGASMMGSMQGGAMPQPGIGTAILGLIISIPLAYLVVLVPAGIYRELGEPAAAAQVFA